MNLVHLDDFVEFYDDINRASFYTGDSTKWVVARSFEYGSKFFTFVEKITVR